MVLLLNDGLDINLHPNVLMQGTCMLYRCDSAGGWLYDICVASKDLAGEYILRNRDICVAFGCGSYKRADNDD